MAVSMVTQMLLQPQLQKLLTRRLINLPFASGRFPNVFLVAKLLPILKQEILALPEIVYQYKFYTFSARLQKIYMYYFKARAFIEQFGILSDTQFRVKINKSPIDAVIKLVELILDGLQNSEHLLGVFLDLSKTFAFVHRACLLNQ